MKLRLASLAMASQLLTFPLTGLAQALEVVRLNDATPLMVGAQAYEKYITRSSFATLTLDDLVFAESIPGKLMLDLTVVFNSDTEQIERMRILFDELIEDVKPGELRKLKLSGVQLGKPVSLSRVTSIDVSLRLIPVVQNQFESAYALMTPILSKPLYGIDIGGLIDKFSEVAASSDKKARLAFRATIPVPQNVIEAQRLDKLQSNRTPPLHNNTSIAIEFDGMKAVTDASVLGKVADAFNGVSLFLSGRELINRPTSAFKGAAVLRFNKDRTQALSETLIENLKDLSNSADNAFSPENITYVNTKHGDSIRLIEAAAKAKQIDSRAEFHLRRYADMARIWALYKQASSVGDSELKAKTNWQNQFASWHNAMKIQGTAQLTQAYGVQDIYPERKIARVFVPYSLTDEMTLELIQRQISIHQSLGTIGILALSEQRP